LEVRITGHIFGRRPPCTLIFSIPLVVLFGTFKLTFIAHLAFRPGELLSSLFVRRLSSVNISRPWLNLKYVGDNGMACTACTEFGEQNGMFVTAVLAVDDRHVTFCDYNGSVARIICVAVATMLDLLVVK
jgi:hypothetical protein